MQIDLGWSQRGKKGGRDFSSVQHNVLNYVFRVNLDTTNMNRKWLSDCCDLKDHCWFS